MSTLGYLTNHSAQITPVNGIQTVIPASATGRRKFLFFQNFGTVAGHDMFLNVTGEDGTSGHKIHPNGGFVLFDKAVPQDEIIVAGWQNDFYTCYTLE